MGLRAKLLLLMIVVALLPLVVLNYYWYRSTESSLQTAAESSQIILKNSDVYRVNQYMNDKVSALIIHSQSPSVYNLQLATAKQDLQGLLNQDSDITQLTLTNSRGMSVLSLNRKGSLPTGQNLSQTNAYRVTNYLDGREYISPVTYNTDKRPIVTIAVPLVNFSTAHNLSNLSTAVPGQLRTASQINGVLIEQVDLTNLWNSVLSQNSSTSGVYAYVVDSEGTLIAYPNLNYEFAHQELANVPSVEAFLKKPTASPKALITKSEKGVSVLSSYGQVTSTGWGVIAEEPTSVIFASANHIQLIGMLIFVIAAVVTLILSFLASRTVTKPIRSLVGGAEDLSRGNLKTRLRITTKDEIGLLGTTFNRMADKLSAIVLKAEAEAEKANIMLNNVNEGILALDKEGRILIANVSAAVLIGDMPKNIIGCCFVDSYHLNKDQSDFLPSMHELGIYKELELINLNKRIHQVDMLVNPISNDPSGICTIVTIIDRTDERQLENMKVDFVSMAAHELRTPMTTIRGYVDLIKNDEENHLPPAFDEYFDHIESSSVDLVGLINNLLNVSKIERGALTLKLDKVDWVDLIKKSLSDRKFSADAKNISLEYNGPDGPIYILADQLSIQEVINNLVNNAINFTEEGGEVKVHFHETVDDIVVDVIDNGVGIPAASIDHLFTKFFRANSGYTSGSGGTGLGLFISKSIIELHQGELTVESKEGIGSTFTIRLPKFDETKYTKDESNKPNNIRQKHGWLIKDTSSRG